MTTRGPGSREVRHGALRSLTLPILALGLVTIAVAWLATGEVSEAAGNNPTITSVDPNTIETGSTSVLLTITGTHFTSSSQVEWNGVAQSTTYVSSTELQALVVSDDPNDNSEPFDNAGDANIIVVNPGPPHRESGPYVVTVADCLPDPQNCVPGNGELCECETHGNNCTMTNTFNSEFSQLQLEVQCTPPPSAKNLEANVNLTNTSTNLEYQVKVRAEVTCPSDPNQPEICMCPDGFDDWFEEGSYLCNDYSCNSNLGPNPNQPDFTAYPKQMKIVGDPNVSCTQDGDWMWCSTTLGPGESLGKVLAVLNTCCDCDRVRKSIVCGDAEATAVRTVGSPTWTSLNDSRFGVTGDCRNGTWLHPDVKDVAFECFAPLTTSCPARSATITSGPPDPSCVPEADFTFTSCDSPDCECRIDDGSWSSCSSPLETLVPGSGEHRFYVRDTSDENPTPDKYTWTIDPNGPGC